MALAGLQVTQPEIHARAHLVRASLDDLFVDFDGSRIQAESKIDDAQESLTFGVLRLQLERSLELFFGLRNAVVLEQLAAAVQVVKKIFAVEAAGRGRRFRIRRAGLRQTRRARAQRALRRALRVRARRALSWIGVVTHRDFRRLP